MTWPNKAEAIYPSNLSQLHRALVSKILHNTGDLQQLTTRVTHVLPVSDDGGSTAEIVRVLGGPAVGDIRSRCLRLADDSNEEASVLPAMVYEGLWNAVRMLTLLLQSEADHSRKYQSLYLLALPLLLIFWVGSQNLTQFCQELSLAICMWQFKRESGPKNNSLIGIPTVKLSLAIAPIYIQMKELYLAQYLYELNDRREFCRQKL